jgi:hypothetical protein
MKAMAAVCSRSDVADVLEEVLKDFRADEKSIA